MTGKIHIKSQGSGPISYRSSSLKPEQEEEEEVWPPKYWEIDATVMLPDHRLISFAFTDPRRLGRVAIKRDNKPDDDLAPDALNDYSDKEEFLCNSKSFQESSRTIKSLLMDQSGYYAFQLIVSIHR
jgi:formamidopyrimidine-DNA glycosylase